MRKENYEFLVSDFHETSHRHSNNLANGLMEEAKEVKASEEAGDTEAMLDELADCLWYITSMALGEGCSLEKLMKRNIAKLEHRALNGKG
jgi:NTP pyrophosphatase (non-canonical NTP hydrolase)